MCSAGPARVSMVSVHGVVNRRGRRLWQTGRQMDSLRPVSASRFPSLFLFDIDGTLVRRAGPQHRQALEYAAAQVLGVRASTEGIPVHGMLDTDIVTVMLRR